jgi:hypothetical protein
VEAFGKSLAELVDRKNPANSILLLKPTLRVAHTGGERIVKSSADETALKSWIDYLTKLSAAELAEAQRYRQEQVTGYGVAPKAVLRRLTHSQYRIRSVFSSKTRAIPTSLFPPEDYVNGFKNQYQRFPHPDPDEAYSRRRSD